jgi:hypothetical protein
VLSDVLRIVAAIVVIGASVLFVRNVKALPPTVTRVRARIFAGYATAVIATVLLASFVVRLAAAVV